ncbi:MAG: redox-regulated ATPase YchF [bacterium]|nr:redox-regulated ATPase YchF [bacterium]
MKVGIVGLPNVGKSTLFNALLKRQVAQSANYPFTTIDPNIGVVEVPDSRLEQLAKVSNSEKIVPAVVEFVDIAGLVKDAHKGEGLGNKFLSHIREVHAIAHVVRAFEDSNVVRSGSSVDAESDVETINTELILADIETIQKLVDNKEKELKGLKEARLQRSELELLIKLKNTLEKGELASSVKINNEEEDKFVHALPLLTIKPIIYVFNVAENDLTGTDPVSDLEQKFQPNVVISAKIESELSSLTEAEQKDYLKELGLEKSGLERFIQTSYKLLGLITYFTSGPKETRAWTIKQGTKAPAAAGEIHTDFEKGFIKAAVISWPKLVETGGWKNAADKGLLRLEGKDYVMADGDVVEFKFNVSN